MQVLSEVEKLERDILFLGMDIHKECVKLINEFYDVAIENMTEEQVDIYDKGIEDAMSCILWLLHRDKLDDAAFTVHIEDLEWREEFFKTDLFKLADKRGYKILKVK